MDGTTTIHPQAGPTRPVSIRMLDVDDQRLRVAIWPGDKAKVPLLLCNGIGARLELLEPFVETLVGVETIAFDVPGTGESPLPRLPYRLWMLARLVSRLLDALGYGRVDVLGVSWGGTLAQQFALQNPRRCRKLVLAATAQGVPMLPGRLSVFLKFMTPRRYNDPVYRRKIAGEIYGGRARTQPGLMRALGPRMQPTSKLGYLLQQLAIAGWSSVPWLPLLRQPTLILAGDDDPVIALANAKLMAGLIRRSRLHVVHDGHLFLLSSAVEASAVVRDFLAVDDAGDAP